MSYARVNDASDSEDEASSNNNTTTSAIHSVPPPPRTRRTGSVAAATLAALTRGSNSNRQGYSRLDEDDDAAEGSPTQGPGSAEVDQRRQEDEQSHEQTGQTRRQSQDQVQGSRTEENADLEINIRFGEEQDLSLRVPRTDTIEQVKDKIKEARPSIENKYLRLIHSGKILIDNKTLIESLPKSLFTQVEVPHQHHQSRLSSSVEAVEAAANNILAGIASRTSGEKSTPPTVRTHTSLGSILPTHVSTMTTSNTASKLSPSPPSATTATVTHPLSSGGGGGHVIIDIPSDASSHGNNKNLTSTSTISIPVQTGPIYFLCSLSDFPPAQPAGPTAVRKGKAVATGVGNNSNNSTSGRLRRDGPSRPSRSRGLNASHIPSQSSSSAAAAAAVRVGASSPLSLPGSSGGGNSSSSRRHGSRHRREDGRASEDEDEAQVGADYDEDEEEEEEEEEELSPIMAPQATGFDRLREAGFSEDEIRSIRRQFHASRGTVTSTVGENGIAVGLDQDEDASARARRIEEEWIDQHGAETLPEGLEGSYGEMVWGLMLGFFMGLIVLFWFKEATFSRRQQMGIIAGMMINVGFGVLHLYY
ncbi:hypothetical protein BG015_011056 [Linnemannia schmuckeri]|uniref:Ubiquitin-like domain-containing protein n=1 Tax=Linnemannia schmuckeri TaxID=64567 RepID=A0A9P5S4P9_9FUNG|nr:hypothetical protein BG015_011056 [Linnemannia schmuckeri]